MYVTTSTTDDGESVEKNVFIKDEMGSFTMKRLLEEVRRAYSPVYDNAEKFSNMKMPHIVYQMVYSNDLLHTYIQLTLISMFVMIYTIFSSPNGGAK